MFRFAVKRLVPLLAGLTVLSACSSPEIPADSFFRLDAGRSQTVLQAPKLSGTLTVNRFAAEGPVGDRPILFAEQATPFQLQQYHYSYWSEPPGVMLADALTDFLRSANAAETVVFAELRLPATFYVNGRILRFERLLGDGRPQAIVSLELSLERASDGRTLMLQTYSAHETAAGDAMTDTVLAFRRALNSAYGRFLQDLSAL
ncbi:MAG: hypothetical protein CMM50_02330 [Rhodospirillaceae bacterium]|mgnify:CR=1 FL=1|nr:hypothetical protein [Rhodospirillaceae bacterium]